MPVVIQDKNGKTTTVHRNVNAPAAVQGASIPAPSVPKPSGMTAHTAFDVLQGCGITLSNTEHGIDNISYLGSAHPKLLEEMVTAISESDGDTRELWCHVLGSRAYHPQNDEEDIDYSNSYKRLIHTIPLGVKLHPDMPTEQRSRRIRDLVSQCESKMGWRPKDRPYRSETNAAMIVVAASPSSYRFDFKGRMEDIFWIADNLEKVEPLIPELLKRKETSRGFIENLLENKSKALTDGLL